MLKGGYEFKTASRKLMEIQSGEPNVKIVGNQDWRLITEGMNFNVPKNSSFCLEVLELVNYTCSYFVDLKNQKKQALATDLQKDLL